MLKQIICITMDLALNNLQRLICHKTQTNQCFYPHIVFKRRSIGREVWIKLYKPLVSSTKRRKKNEPKITIILSFIFQPILEICIWHFALQPKWIDPNYHDMDKRQRLRCWSVFYPILSNGQLFTTFSGC